jgi:AcrR family transcriptional regulator
MANPPLIRPGGRSERIQNAVHAAVIELRLEHPEADLTITMIAERASVTPSTIYRRWQSLPKLLADVALHRIHSDPLPPDTGSLRTDLLVLLEQFVEDICSGPGRVLLQERVSNVTVARRAAGYAYGSLAVLADNAKRRGEVAPDPDRLLDLLVAPVLYRIVFTGQDISTTYQASLVDIVMAALPLAARPLEGQTSMRIYIEDDD